MPAAAFRSSSCSYIFAFMWTKTVSHFLIAGPFPKITGPLDNTHDHTITTELSP